MSPTFKKILLGAVVAVVVVPWAVDAISNATKSPEERAQAAEAAAVSAKRAAAERAAADAIFEQKFACEQSVKKRLRDPKSYEHVNTVRVLDKDGLPLVAVEYRARNGFGGMNAGLATCSFKQDKSGGWTYDFASVK